jgi:hypothetical protein
VLGEAGAKLWQAIHGDYVIEDASGCQILLQICEGADSLTGYDEQIAHDGPTIRTTSGLREHPLLKHQLATRSFIVRSLHRLGLDIIPPRHGLDCAAAIAFPIAVVAITMVATTFVPAASAIDADASIPPDHVIARTGRFTAIVRPDRHSVSVLRQRAPDGSSERSTCNRSNDQGSHERSSTLNVASMRRRR